jgi:TRAP-type C4-dicarboxylate transport system substrate-binding protein
MAIQTSILRRGMAATMIGMAASMVDVAAAVAQQLVWRFDSLVVESRPEAKHFAAFADRVFKQSNERLKIDVYYGKALGINEPEHLRAIKSGAVEMIGLIASLYSRDAPELSVILPQGVVKNNREMATVARGVTDLLTEAFKKWDANVVGWVYPPFHNISVVCKDKVDNLEQLKPKKLRVWAQEQVASFNKLGVAAQIMSQSDIYVSMQTGVIDCALYGVPTVPTISLQEVARHASALHAFSAIPFALAVNNTAWKKLPDDLKAVVEEAGDWMSKKSFDEARNSTLETDTAKDLSAKGFTISQAGFPDADRQAYYEAASAMWEERAKKLGPLTEKYRHAIIEKLEEARR